MPSFRKNWKLEILSEAPAILGALETYIAAERNLPGVWKSRIFVLKTPTIWRQEIKGVIKLSNSSRSIREKVRKRNVT
jgi:hypothetical protein